MGFVNKYDNVLPLADDLLYPLELLDRRDYDFPAVPLQLSLYQSDNRIVFAEGRDIQPAPVYLYARSVLT